MGTFTTELQTSGGALFNDYCTPLNRNPGRLPQIFPSYWCYKFDNITNQYCIRTRWLDMPVKWISLLTSLT